MFNNFDRVFNRFPIFSYRELFDDNIKSNNLDKIAIKFLNDPVFLESIFWSSNSFYQVLHDYKLGKISDEKKRKNILLTLKKYIIRSATRPTPYGTFAGVSLSDINKNVLKENITKRKLRVDSEVLLKIIASIELNPAFSKYINYYLNNTIYKVNKEFRFLEVNSNENNEVQLSSLEKSRVLQKIFTIFKNKHINFESFYFEFSNEFSKNDLHFFFKELISMKFFVSELEICLTCENDFQKIKEFFIRERVNISKEANLYIRNIEKIETYITKLQNENIGNFYYEDYIEIKKGLTDLGISIDDKPIFQVDLLNDVEETFHLSNKKLKNLYESIEILSKIINQKNKITYLEKFKQLFLEKYETKSVALLEVLDVDFGIGFSDNENIGNINAEFFKTSSNFDIKKKEEVSNITDWLKDKIESSNNDQPIEILKKDFEDLALNKLFFSNTFYVVGQNVGNKNIILQNVGGISGNTLLSRFSYIEKGIKELCKEISCFDQKSSPDVIFAEVIWSENSKVANISRSITVLDYEIPIFHNSSKDKTHTIFLNDLFVSIQNNEIILTSKKLKKRVIPKLSNAHNFKKSNNPIYKFLCSISYQNTKSFEIKIDFENTKKRFIPRIFYKNIILFSAHWVLQKEDIKMINQSSFPITELKKFMEKWKVPQYLVLVQGDNELFLDTVNDSYLDILIDEIKKNKIIILKEWHYEIQNASKSYVNQFVLPLKKTLPTPQFDIRRIDFNKNIQRTFMPGNDWIYFKIYCSSSFSDSILKEIYNKFINKLRKENVIEKWFFIRYKDPHHHIRLRLKLANKEYCKNIYFIFNQKLKPYLDNKVIWKISIDTYQRELERYGCHNIDDAESIFFYDSEFFLKFLKKGLIEDIDSRFFLAAKNLDYWLSILKMSNEEKMNFCKHMKNIFAKEKTKDFLKTIDDKFRDYKVRIFNFLDNDEFSTIFNHYKINKRILNDENISHYIHMSVNRWFESNQRDWEYFLYYICYEYYKQKFYKSKIINED